MEEIKNEETEVEETEEVEEETPEEDLTPETDWKAEAKKARGIAQRLRTKLTKASEKKLDTVEPKVKVEPVKEEPNTGGLDENALDFLDLKGITEDEDIALIENIITKTGQTVRQVLKDDYVKSKLETNKTAREVKDATPSNTKRSGAQGDTLDVAIAKYESTGEYPEDFELRSKVVNKLEEKHSTSVPGYRK